MKRLLFIAHLGLKEDTDPNGVNVKNRHILKYLNQKSNIKTTLADTANWKRSFIGLFIKIVCSSFYYDTIILSANTNSADKIIKFFWFFGLNRKTVYLTVGGSFAKKLSLGVFNTKHYKNLQRILVETYKMESDLKDLGLVNIERMPNSKYFDDIYIEEYKTPNIPINCYYLGRIHPEKGIDMIFDALSEINKNGTKYRIDFYGPIEREYKDSFYSNLKNHSFAKYKGIIKLTENKAGYEELSQYDLFLFPTFWHGEGFPGVVIDSFISGVPVIASDWNHNTEVIQDGHNGIIFKNKNLKDFKEKLFNIADNPDVIGRMKKNAHDSSQNFKSENVLKALDKMF